MPETAGRFSRHKLGNDTDRVRADDRGTIISVASGVNVYYDYGDLMASISDLIDAPDLRASTQREFAERRFFGMSSSASIEDIEVAGLPALAVTGGALGPRLLLLIADRFVVEVQQSGGAPFGVDELVAFVEESALPRLAEAPAFADAGDPAIPEWAATQAAENAAAAEEYRRLAIESQSPGAAQEPTGGALKPCDEILSGADISRVLGASVDVRPTPGIEVDGRNCNRLYKPTGIEGGIILIVSHYTNTRQALGALRVASEHDGKVGLQPLANGLNGVQYTHDLESDIHISHFAIGTTFVELKATAAGESVPEVTPEQLAEVTAIVAQNLGE